MFTTYYTLILRLYGQSSSRLAKLERTEVLAYVKCILTVHPVSRDNAALQIYFASLC